MKNIWPRQQKYYTFCPDINKQWQNNQTELVEMESIGKPEMNSRKYGSRHAASITLMAGKIPEEAYCVLVLKPFTRDKIDHNRDNK